MRRSVRFAGIGLAAIAGVAAACTSASSSTTLPPVRQTAKLTSLERQIAGFARAHPRVTGIGPYARCSVAVIDQVARSAVTEVLCSSTTNPGSSVDLGCVPRPAQSFVTVGVATLDARARPVALRLDMDNDAAYNEWIRRNVTPRAQGFEVGGPRDGAALERRLTSAYGCNAS